MWWVSCIDKLAQKKYKLTWHAGRRHNSHTISWNGMHTDEIADTTTNSSCTRNKTNAEKWWIKAASPIQKMLFQFFHLGTWSIQ